MSIPLINYQSPFAKEHNIFNENALTVLELCAVMAGKVDECITIVNGVEQIAIEATAIVDEMKLQQEQFVQENNDARVELLAENQNFIETLNASKHTFETQVNNAISSLQETYNSTTTSMSSSYNEFMSNMNSSLELFIQTVNDTKTQFTNDINSIIENSNDIIKTHVIEKVIALVNDGTIANVIGQTLLKAMKDDIEKNTITVSPIEPTTLSKIWLDVKSETDFIIGDGESIIIENI